MRNIMLCAAVVSSIALPSGRSWSEEQPGVEFRLAPEVLHVAYREPGIMREIGIMAGMEAGARLAAPPVEYALSLSFVAGDLDYSAGPNKYAPQRLEFTTSGGIVNLRGTAGYLFSVGEYPSRLFSGLGYRYLWDDIPDYGVLQGYLRQQTYYYLPVGVSLDRPLAGNGQIGIEIEFDLLLLGQNDSDGQKMTQDSGYGYCVSLRYTSPVIPFDRLPDMSFFVEPFFQYWNVGKSDASSLGWYEPDNNSTAFGLRAGAWF